jgi:hypothetical protein
VWALITQQGGFEELFCRRIGTGCEIICITPEQTTDRIAIGTRDRVVQVWVYNIKDGLQSVFSIQLDTTIPRAVDFVDNTAKDVYVFGLYNGLWYDRRFLPRNSD